MLTTFDLDDYVYRALRAGASGFLLKDTAPEQLLAAIRTLAAGDALLAPGITRRLIREFAQRPETGPRPSAGLLDPLSVREREVLVEVAGGWSNSEIGERLHISAATAKTHVSRLLMKLNAHDRAQLVMIAYETGLVTPGEPPAPPPLCLSPPRRDLEWRRQIERPGQMRSSCRLRGWLE